MNVYYQRSNEHIRYEDYKDVHRTSHLARVLEEGETPPLNAAYTLDHFVRHKPAGRRGNRHAKPSENVSAAGQDNILLGQDDRKQESTGFAVKDSFARKVSQMLTLRVRPGAQTLFAEFDKPGPAPNPSDVFEIPRNAAFPTGCIRYCRHSNGDVTFLQWIMAEASWKILAAMDQEHAAFLEDTAQARLSSKSFVSPDGVFMVSDAQDELVKIIKTVVQMQSSTKDQNTLCAKWLTEGQASPLTRQIRLALQQMAAEPVFQQDKSLRRSSVRVPMEPSSFRRAPRSDVSSRSDRFPSVPSPRYPLQSPTSHSDSQTYRFGDGHGQGHRLDTDTYHVYTPTRPARSSSTRTRIAKSCEHTRFVDDIVEDEAVTRQAADLANLVRRSARSKSMFTGTVFPSVLCGGDFVPVPLQPAKSREPANYTQTLPRTVLHDPYRGAQPTPKKAPIGSLRERFYSKSNVSTPQQYSLARHSMQSESVARLRGGASTQQSLPQSQTASLWSDTSLDVPPQDFQGPFLASESRNETGYWATGVKSKVTPEQYEADLKEQFSSGYTQMRLREAKLWSKQATRVEYAGQTPEQFNARCLMLTLRARIGEYAESKRKGGDYFDRLVGPVEDCIDRPVAAQAPIGTGLAKSLSEEKESATAPLREFYPGQVLRDPRPGPPPGPSLGQKRLVGTSRYTPHDDFEILLGRFA